MPTLTTSLQVRTIADLLADWTQSFSFFQFDPSLGTLQGIHIGLTGDVAASAAIENLGSAPATVTVSMPGTINLIGPDNVIITQVQPTASASTTSLAAFDGTKDFSGASGTTLTGLSDVVSTSTSS